MKAISAFARLSSVPLFLVVAAAPASASVTRGGPTAVDLILAGLIPIFDDDFESTECSFWSASTNPPGAPDGDADLFGDETQPTVYCQLPGGLVADATDCDDGDASVFPNAPELCNEIDDDCDEEVDEGYLFGEDEQNCGECGNICQPTNCTNVCTNAQCVPTCNFGFFNCNGNPEDGCEAGRNTNPACPGTMLADVAGDSGNDIRVTNGFTEAWYFVSIVDGPGIGNPLTARISLSVPAGVDFDLYVYCFDCGGTLAGSSTLGVGQDEQVLQLTTDDFSASDTHVLAIEIRFAGGGGTNCSNWTLTVEGNTGGAAASTCES